jgi:hypothetical protein
MTAAPDRAHGAVDQLAVALRLFRVGALARELRDVGAGGESLLARAAQHHAAQAVVGGKLAHDCAEPLPHGLVQRVELVGIIERHGGDEVITLDQHWLTHG